MSAAPDDRSLAGLLPGRWRVLATSYPSWFIAVDSEPTLEYTIASHNPLEIVETLHFTDPKRGARERVGRSRWIDGAFVRRGTGARRFTSSVWSVVGAAPNGSVVAVRSEKGVGNPAATTLWVREGVRTDELRSLVAHDISRFGLTPEEFAGLAWW